MRQDTLQLHISQVEQVNAIKANDPKTLKALYEDNFAKIENYIVENNGTSEQAKDIYQEAFIALWRNIQLDRFIPGNATALGGYLYKIAKNKWLDHLRSSHYKNTRPLNDGFENENIELLPEEESRYITEIRHQFTQLGANCKEVLTKFYYEKEPLKQIARKFDWTEATARNNKYRCLQRLRELLKYK